MTNEKGKKPSLPKMPSAKSNLRSSTDDEYYIKTQASSLLSKYSGKNKLEIMLAKDEKIMLEHLESVFQNKFDLNHVICFAYKCLKNGHPRVSEHRNLNKRLSEYSVKIKPSQETLEAIFSYGEKDAGSYLSGLGIYILSRDLSLDSMFKFNES